MSNSVTLILGYKDSEQTRNIKLENYTIESIDALKAKITAFHNDPYWKGATVGPETRTLFVDDNWDGTTGGTGTCLGIVAAKYEEIETINFDLNNVEGGD